MTAFSGFEQAIADVSLLGSSEPVEWELTKAGLEVTHPVSAGFSHAAVYKVALN